MAILKRVNGEAPGQIIELKNELTVIGRSPECQIVLDPNGVSRHHAQIRKHMASSSSLPTSIRGTRPMLNKPSSARDRLCTETGRPAQHLRRRVHLPYYPPEGVSRPQGHNVMVVTEGESTSTTRRCTRSTPPVRVHWRSAVRPEVKLKAILEIARNLSSELQIDAVAPKILDSLVELFPQAERLFLMLLEPDTKRLVRKAFKYRPSRKSPFSAARSPKTKSP